MAGQVHPAVAGEFVLVGHAIVCGGEAAQNTPRHVVKVHVGALRLDIAFEPGMVLVKETVIVGREVLIDHVAIGSLGIFHER